MADLDNVIFIQGGKELLPRVKPLWEQLNHHHLCLSTFFKPYFSSFSFEKRQQQLLTEPGMEVMVGLVVDQNLIMEAGYCITSLTREGIGEIESLFIQDKYRKMGLGDRLMDRAIQWLQEKEAKTMLVSVAEGNEKVFPFYERFGFYPRKVLLEYIPPEKRT